ncbi:MAG: DUF2333 family protein [Oceanospirillaceae bacterium]|nr:DUF2333 family protein [Oceanospirillaceae bacterium]
MELLQRIWFGFWDRLVSVLQLGTIFKATFSAIVLYVVISTGFAVYWSVTPDIHQLANSTVVKGKAITGVATTDALIHISQTLLTKPGGYLSNDKTLPGIWMDNVPRWEFGVLVQARDMARSMRKDFSRSQSQSTEDLDLTNAEPRLHFNNDSWMFPATESEYRKAIDYLKNYQRRLSDPSIQDAQFYARADNLNQWLADVSTRLGSLSQRLSASVGQRRINTDLAGDAQAEQSTATAKVLEVKTSWNKIDDVFYEARGTAWALIYLLRAIDQDFSAVLEKKNARISLLQIIRELEATQGFVWSPMILNGSEFGLWANHSLVMSSYITRANAAIIDLRDLLTKG